MEEIDLLTLMVIADRHPNVCVRVGFFRAMGFGYCASCAVDRAKEIQHGGLDPILRLASEMFIDRCNRCRREVVPNPQVLHGN